MTVYIGGSTLLLWLIGFWRFDQLKDTILWICLSGFVMILNFVTSSNDDNIFRRICIDNIKLIIVIEFIVNSYTFSIVTELLFVPLFVFLVALDAVARLDEKHSQVARFTGGLLVIIGITVLTLATTRAITDYSNIANFDTARSVLLAPLLSVTFAPYVYMLLIISTYEKIFIRLKIGPEKAKEVMSYARRQIILQFGLRLTRLRAFSRSDALSIIQVRSENELDLILDEFKKKEKKRG